MFQFTIQISREAPVKTKAIIDVETASKMDTTIAKVHHISTGITGNVSQEETTDVCLLISDSTVQETRPQLSAIGKRFSYIWLFPLFP